MSRKVMAPERGTSMNPLTVDPRQCGHPVSTERTRKLAG
jgi:hypothetical protein